MKSKNLVTRALSGFTKAKTLLEQAIKADSDAIAIIDTKVSDLETTKVDHNANMKYANTVLGKINTLLKE